MQNFSKVQAFSLAAHLASTFQQESVAVFIPSSQQPVSHMIIRFKSYKPSVTNVIKIIHDQLPDISGAFSLHLTNKSTNFNHARVAEIEWLVSKINLNEVERVFQRESISFDRGKAYLVYQNGHIQLL